MFALRAPYHPSIVCAGPRGEPPAATAEPWARWFREHRDVLSGGEEHEIPVPPDLPHPSRSGFTPTSLAEAVGQVHDWALPISDGSRLHVHEFEDGSMSVHRDATDPSRGLTSAVWHWVTESRSGRIIVVAGVVLFAGSHLVARLAR